MLDLVSKLPPHSFVLLGMLMRDASGVTYNEDDGAGASARGFAGADQRDIPARGGPGDRGRAAIPGGGRGGGVGGAWRRESCGQPASNIPPKVIGTRNPTYDWRELTRWHIPESRLSPGSVVLFREPTTWQRYRWYV